MEREIDQINHRFDDLSRQMDRRFEEQSKRFEEQGQRLDELGRRVETGFSQLAGRLDTLQRTLIQIAFGAFFTFGASLIGYFLTRH